MASVPSRILNDFQVHKSMYFHAVNICHDVKPQNHMSKFSTKCLSSKFFFLRSLPLSTHCSFRTFYVMSCLSHEGEATDSDPMCSFPTSETHKPCELIFSLSPIPSRACVTVSDMTQYCHLQN